MDLTDIELRKLANYVNNDRRNVRVDNKEFHFLTKLLDKLICELKKTINPSEDEEG